MRAPILAVLCLGFSLIAQAQVLDANALQAQLAQLGLGTSLDGIGAITEPVQCSTNEVELDMLKMQLQQAQGIITRLYSVIKNYEDKTTALTQLIQSQQSTVNAYESQILNLTASSDQCYGDLSACNNGTMQLTDQLDDANQLNSNLSRQLSQAEGEKDVCVKTLQQVVVQRDDLSRSKIACLDNLSSCITALDNCTSEHQDVTQIHAAVSGQLRNCTLENQDLGEVVANLTGEVASTENELNECSRSVDQCKIEKDDCNDELVEKVRELGVLSQEQAACNSTLAQKIKDLDDTEQKLKKCQSEKADCTSDLNKSEAENNKFKHQALMKTSKKTCQEWHALKIPSGEYMVDPDGENKGVAPFKVMCDFNKTPVETKVVRGPSKLETKVKGSYRNKCTYASEFGIPHPSSGSGDKAKRSSEQSSAEGSKMCEHDTMKYGVEREQLAALTAVATSCKQVVSWTCANQDELVLFTNSGENVKRVYKNKWFSRSYTQWKRYFLDFSNESKAECDCAGSCVADSKLACNCYANKPNTFTDTITLTNKSDLPVMYVGLGDLNREAETGMVSVGDLVCV